MARRRSLNRLRNLKRSRSIDSVSGRLDPDTDIVGEEQPFWWNNLRENTYSSYSLIHNENETAKQLSDNSQTDSQDRSQWWRNLEFSDSEHTASASSRRNFSAAIVKASVLQTSTSESEKEPDLKKRKVRLRATSRKSTGNAFLNAVDDAEVAIPLKLRQKQASRSDLNSDSDREVSRRRLQEDEEDSSISTNILKPKPSISRRRRDGSTKDQNAFQDILTQDGVLDGSATKISVSLEKESSKRSMHRDIDASRNHIDDRKSIRVSQAIPSESNANEIIQSSDESDIKIVRKKRSKLKSHLMRQARRSMGKNVFADAVADNDSASFSTSNMNKEEDIHESSLMPGSSLNSSNRSVTRSNTDVTHEGSSIRRSPRSSLNAAKKQLLDIPVQAKDNIEANSSSSSLDNNESRGKSSVFLKPKSRIIESLRNKSPTKNPFEEIFEEGHNISAGKSNVSNSSSLDNDESRGKSSVFLKPKSEILKSLRKKSPTKNPFEEIFEEGDGINARKSNESTTDNHASFERHEATTRISQAHGSSTTEKSAQLRSNKSTSKEDFYDISLVVSSNDERSVSKKSNPSSENSDVANISKSTSQKSVVAKTREKQISFSRKSAREETLKEHIPTNTIVPAGRTSINQIVAHEIISDDSYDNINREQDLNMHKRLSSSSPGKEARLTRNSLRNRSETPKPANIEVHKVIHDSHIDANREQDSSIRKRLFSSSPGTEARLTRNSLRNRSETPKPANIEVHKVIHDSHIDANREQDSSIRKRLPSSSPGTEVRLTRNSLRNRSETPKPANIGVHEVIHDSHIDANRERDSSIRKRLPSSSPGTETRLTRNSLRNRSETPKPANIGVHEVIHDSHIDANRERDSSIRKRLPRSSPGTETRLTRNSLRIRSETPKPVSKDVELSRRSGNWIANSEEIDDTNADSELNIDVSQVVSSTRISTALKINANVGTHKSAVPVVEMETDDDEDADPAMQAAQRNFTLTEAETNNKAVNRQNSNRTSIKEDRETARRQKSLSKSQNYHSTPIKASSKNISSNISKLNSYKTFIQDRKIDDFFKVKQSSINKQSSDRSQNLTSQVLDSEKMEKIKTELERIKNREMIAMKIDVTADKKEFALKAKNVRSLTMLKQATKKKLPTKPTKVVDKAFLVDGKVYKAPRLPRPKHWATDRLYKFLWKRMEPKYKLATRVKSEKFVQELAKMVTFIERRKNYDSYKKELEAVMKEMARLKIISTRNDFYHFCQDFLPYEFRVKVVPMLLPGNKNNIPYNPEKLHAPLLE